MTDTTEQQAVTVAQVDRNDCADFGRMISRLTTRDADNVRAGEWDNTRDVQFFAQRRHRLASVSSASADHGCSNEDGSTNFYRGAPVLTHSTVMHAVETNWNSGPDNLVAAVLALAASPAPVPATNQAGEVEAWEQANPFPKAPYGCDHQAKYLLPQADWFAAKAKLIRSLATQPAPVPATNQAGEVAAAEAIRSAFFTSVSGEKPHRYHLSLAYPTMEAMHEAEDAIKAWAKSVLDTVSATQPATSQEVHNG